MKRQETDRRLRELFLEMGTQQPPSDFTDCVMEQLFAGEAPATDPVVTLLATHREEITLSPSGDFSEEIMANLDRHLPTPVSTVAPNLFPRRFWILAVTLTVALLLVGFFDGRPAASDGWQFFELESLLVNSQKRWFLFVTLATGGLLLIGDYWVSTTRTHRLP